MAQPEAYIGGADKQTVSLPTTQWADLPQVHTAQVTLTPEIEGATADLAYA
jgi:hypothetical protein